MKHLFVPYEIALQLKEKGFDEPCFGIWMERGAIFDILYVARQEDAWMANENNGILAPLYQQVIDWFREKHSIDILPQITYGSHISEESGDWFYFTVYNGKTKKAKRFLRVILINTKH